MLASYIHAGVFVPVLNPTPSTDRFTFSPLSNGAMKLAYWDEDAYVTELTVSTGEPESTNGNGNANGKSRADLSSTATADAEGLLKPSKDGEKSKKRKADPSTVPAVKKVNYTPPSTVTLTNKSKSAPSHLQFWSNRHAELHGIEPSSTATSPDQPSNSPSSSKPPSTQKANPKPSTPDTKNPPPTQSFADLVRNCCLLCARQFKTAAEVHRHERLSQLHRDNLANDTLKEKALAKMSKLGITQTQGETGPEYRDRARERRQQHKLPMKATSTSAPSKSAKSESPSPSSEPAPMAKGAALLSKMGYEGKGLGRDGSGIAEPIKTDVYAPGVGLGAEGGRRGDAVEEAAGNTRDGADGYKGFVERVREGARGRYDRMQ